jgi:hypothetical protein
VALQKGRASAVANFFITFAQGEGAELEEMLESTNFTIIDDVLSLPERMPGIYRRDNHEFIFSASTISSIIFSEGFRELAHESENR